MMKLQNAAEEPVVYRWCTRDLKDAGVPDEVMEAIDEPLRAFLGAPKIPDNRREGKGL